MGSKIFMIRILMLSVLATTALMGKQQSLSTPSKGQSKMHQMQQKHPDRLPDDQRHVLFMLSPLYQRIYLYALDDDEREMVAVFEKRGENPYQVIDNILKRDRRLSDPSMRNRLSPAEKRRKRSQQAKYIISEEERRNASYEEEDVMAENSDEYEFYDTSKAPRSKPTPSKSHLKKNREYRQVETHKPECRKGCCSSDKSTKRQAKPKHMYNERDREVGGKKKYKFEDAPMRQGRCGKCSSS